MSAPREERIAWVFKDVVVDDEYGISSLSFRPNTILDVGANIGMFSLWAAANFPDALIHAYEPNNALRPYLEANLSQIRAKIFFEGLSGVDGFGSFTVGAESVMAQCKIDQEGDVAVASLKTAIHRMGGFVDLLKLDCEGAEWSILQDSSSFDSVRAIRIEYHLLQEGQTYERLISSFKSMGFTNRHSAQNQGFGIAWFDR